MSLASLALVLLVGIGAALWWASEKRAEERSRREQFDASALASIIEARNDCIREG